MASNGRDKMGMAMIVCGFVGFLYFNAQSDPQVADTEVCRKQVGISQAEAVRTAATDFHQNSAYSRCLQQREGKRLTDDSHK
ncbi:hypothetical protein [Streptomyces sp. NPDC058371]|uniref:hypothetical protein n=1 Tax=Streptomyces sp. NPDC058371 TaxID=3346463 RepID=UPI0036478E6E